MGFRPRRRQQPHPREPTVCHCGRWRWLTKDWSLPDYESESRRSTCYPSCLHGDPPRPANRQLNQADYGNDERIKRQNCNSYYGAVRVGAVGCKPSCWFFMLGKFTLGQRTKANTATHCLNPLFLISGLRSGISSGLPTAIIIWAFASPAIIDYKFISMHWSAS